MENFFDPNFLNENTEDFHDSILATNNNINNNNINRRWSLGNLNLKNTNNTNETRSWSPHILPLTPSPSPHTNFEEQFTFEQTNLFQDINKNNTAPNSFLLNQQLIQQQLKQRHQQQQQLQIQQQIQQKRLLKQQSEENLSNFIKFCSSSGIDLNTRVQQQENQNQQFSTLSGSLPHSSSFFLPSTAQQQPNASNRVSNSIRRKSYGPSAMSSSLKPVMESRSSSPVFSQSSQTQQFLLQQQQAKQNLERKLELNNLLAANSNYQKSSVLKDISHLNTYATPPARPRTRAISTGNMFQFENTSFDTNSKFNSSISSSLSNTGSSMSLSNSSSRIYDSFEEKLAITGNIFQKRDDWSIISKLPINKQNSIHIRVNDEGPYGNDEIRCFVLSHLSSMKVTNFSCVMCSCNLIVYDRFPLIDGILFVSPFDYDKNKSVPTPMSNKKQYMYAICLDCLNVDQMHSIKCKFCDESWQNIVCFALQIGTLYKYDVLAAFPCCEYRLSCNSCLKPVVDLETSKSKHFSSFSQEFECPHCHEVAYHFIKPLTSIFAQTECEKLCEKENEKNRQSN